MCICKRITDSYKLTYAAPVALLCSDRRDIVAHTVSASLHLPALSLAFFHLKFPPSKGHKGEVETKQPQMLGHGYIWGNADGFPVGMWSFLPQFWIWLNKGILEKMMKSLCLSFLFPIEWEFVYFWPHRVLGDVPMQRSLIRKQCDRIQPVNKLVPVLIGSVLFHTS